MKNTGTKPSTNNQEPTTKNIKKKRRGKKIATTATTTKVVQVEDVKIEQVEVKEEVTSIGSLTTITENYLDAICTACEEGLESSFEVYKYIFRLKEVVEKAKKRLESQAIDEASQYNRTELKDLGFEIGYTAKQYKYKEDGEIQRLEQELKERKKVIKLATDNGKEILDKETGEIIEPVEFSASRAYLKRTQKNR